MKHKSIIFVLALFSSFLISSKVSAHPGRTDAHGGHTCRTNCASWGLSDGEYHYHEGGGSTSSGGSIDTANGVGAIQPVYPTHTLIPTRIPTRIPIKPPAPTVTVALSPTTQPTPTIVPTKKAQTVHSNAIAQK
jgi:hypothetical protein